MEIVKKHNSGHVWKRFKLTYTRKANAKKSLELDYPLKDMPNGLAELLDYGRDGFMYCERSEEESKRILDPPSNFVPNDWSVYGFGFNFVKDDYKVVKVGCGTICVY
ncbi:hypothetical protein Goshw_003125 [Gossypium schwendimanii]|uniref:Uncharacterized protein n=1 Tax=Gossypium schwendimanii TaxID=34291 RepID=A0A7J9MFQ7_GOSSC|nr:hypothetical protein [Gossypium schwendimanii]